MKARNPKRRTTGDHFAAVPVEVLTSPAFTTLPNYAVRVLLVAAAQYRGRNNGDIALTWEIAQKYGVHSKKHLVAALPLLLDRGLLVKVKQGGKRPLGPTLYALAWRPIDDFRHKAGVFVGPTEAAPNGWAMWPPSGPSGDREAAAHEKTTGLPGDQYGTPGGPVSAINGTPGGPWEPINGTPGSPPSRSRGGDHAESVVLPLRRSAGA